MAFETSAAEIGRYRGNAETALGSTTGADSGATLIAGDTQAERVNTKADSVILANYNKNWEIYNQKKKDIDDLYESFKSGAVDTKQMLAGDRSLVEKKFLDPIKNMLIANPNLRSDPKKWLEYTEAQRKFNEAKVYGQARFKLISDMDDNIAKEVDPQKRARMQQHREKMIGQDMFERVTPYQQMLDITDDMFANPEAQITSKGEYIEGETVVTETMTHTPVRKFIDATITNSIDSPNKSVMDQMALYRDQVVSMPDTEKAQLVERWDEIAKRAMNDEGITEGSQDYIKPVETHLAPDGSLIINETPQRIALFASLLKNYKNTTTKTPKVSNLPSQIRKNEADMKQTLLENKLLIPAKYQTELARQAKLRAETNKANMDSKKIGAEIRQDEESGDYLLNSLAGMFNEKTFATLPSIRQMDGFKNASFDGKVLAGFSKTAKSNKDSKFTVLSPQEMQAIGRPQRDAEGKVFVQSPDAVVLNVDDPKDPYLVTMYYPTTTDADDNTVPDTNKTPEVVKVRPQSIVGPLVKNLLGDKASMKDVNNMVNRFRSRTGSQDINKYITSLNGSMDPETPAAAPAPVVTKPKNVKPVSDTTTSKRRSFFANKK